MIKLWKKSSSDFSVDTELKTVPHILIEAYCTKLDWLSVKEVAFNNPSASLIVVSLDCYELSNSEDDLEQFAKGLGSWCYDNRTKFLEVLFVGDKFLVSNLITKAISTRSWRAAKARLVN